MEVIGEKGKRRVLHDDGKFIISIHLTGEDMYDLNRDDRRVELLGHEVLREIKKLSSNRTVDLNRSVFNRS